MIRTIEQLEQHLQSSPKMPVIFVGHGNPMNALGHNEISEGWSKIGQELPTPQAFVVISAHWLTRGTFVTDAPTQPIIYDMYGFPDELYKVTYDAKGDPELAKQLVQAMNDYEAKLDSTWGLDHGTWSVMKFIAPDPHDIPVLQISIDMTKDLPSLMDVFRALKPLREKGVIFIGSGNLVHNLAILSQFGPRQFEWATEFDEKASKAIMVHDLHALARPTSMTKAAALAVQHDDHYRPMLAAMSLLDAGESVRFFNDVFELGSISMRSFISV